MISENEWDLFLKATRLRQQIQPITPCAAYRYKDKIYKTPRAAAKAQAWHMIFMKYCGFLGDIKDVKRAAGKECDCAEFDEEYQLRHEICPLHNRHDGYFKSLHKKLVDTILRRNGYFATPAQEPQR